MLRFLLKMMLMAWTAFMLLMLVMLNFGKTAPDISNIAFFSQGFDSTDYWRLDVWTGVAFKTTYAGRLVMPENRRIPLHQFVLLDSGSDFSDISVLNPETQELSFLGTYWTRLNRLSVAGDYIFLMDYANHWTQIDIQTAEMTDFGDYPNLQSLRVSPDGQWLTGVGADSWVFINLLNGNSYEISGYYWIDWSPDSQWYIADNTASISVLSTETGSPHPNLPLDFPTHSAGWSSDGHSIFYLDSQRLASISLEDGQVSEYPITPDYFDPRCLAPNQRYLLLGQGEFENLVRLKTGEIIWQIKDGSIVVLDCLWSQDSRYLIAYYTVYDYGARSTNDEWERFFVIDTLNGVSWDLYPEILPSSPLYLHFSD